MAQTLVYDIRRSARLRARRGAILRARRTGRSGAVQPVANAHSCM